MARPVQTGCQYFPLDCDFFNDRKVRLLRSEFGAKAEAVLIRLWCAIYCNEGWYAHIDDDEIALIAESMGSGFSVGFVKEVIKGACRRGIFDAAVFANFRVLTGEGVQKRYLEIKAKKKTIPVIREYWVLKEAFFKGENESLLLKLQFFSVLAEKTAVNSEITPISDAETPQRKEKERKAEECAAAADPRLDEGVGMVARCYEENIGVLSGHVGHMIIGWMQEGHSAELICAAIGEAVAHNARSAAYVDAVLRRWKTANITTPAAAQAEKAAAAAQRDKRASAVSQQQEVFRRDLTQC